MLVHSSKFIVHSKKLFAGVLVLWCLFLPQTSQAAAPVADDPDGDGFTNLEEYQNGTDPTNVIRNPGFEILDNNGWAENWGYHDSVALQGPQPTKGIATEDPYEGNNCLEMDPRGTTWQYTYQGADPGNDEGTDPGSIKLIPGEDYILQAMYKTIKGGTALLRLEDLDWKNAQGEKKGKTLFSVIGGGNGEWAKIGGIVHIPLEDEFGESLGTHELCVYLYGQWTHSDGTRGTGGDIVYYDDVKLYLGNMFLEPFGPVNDAGSKSIDFGNADINPNGIIYREVDRDENPVPIPPGMPPGEDGDTTYRSIGPKNTLYIDFPAFNIDAEGFPLTPMLLEIRYKDTIDDTKSSGSVWGEKSNHRAFVYSYINYICLDDKPVRKDKKYYEIASLGAFGDGSWRYIQFAFQQSPFPLLRAVNGNFTIKISMPTCDAGDGNLYLPIDYISLRVISKQDYDALVNKQRELRNFYEAQLPPDEPDTPVTYPNPDLVIFVRDIMQPVYKHARPDADEILELPGEVISSFSAPGETEPISFAIYSEGGINNLVFEITDLTKGTDVISKEDYISIYKVAFAERRLTAYERSVPFNKAFALIPDRLEEFSSLNIEPDTSERIWIKINVPDNTPAGIYTGNVTVNSIEIPIELEVLSIELDQPKHISPVYYDPYHSTYSRNLDEVYKLYSETGFDPFIYDCLPKPTGNPGTVDNPGTVSGYNTTEFIAYLNTMFEKGFAKRGSKVLIETYGVWYYHIAGIVYGSYINPLSDTGLYDKLTDTNFQNAYTLFITTMKDIERQKGITFIFSVIDEPINVPYRRIAADILYPIIKANGGKTTVTYSSECESGVSSGEFYYDATDDGIDNPTKGATIPPLIDQINYKVWAPTHQGEGYSRDYDHFGYYTTTTSYLRNPIYNRFLHGLLAFGTDAEIVSAYAMGHLVADPFNDFDTSPENRYEYTGPLPDFVFAYSTWRDDDKMLSTMAIEGIREGIKDAKYIATLERLIAANPTGAIEQNARIYLDTIKGRVNPNYWAEYPGKSNQYGYYQRILEDISDTDNPEDFEAFTDIRADIKDYIIAILNQGTYTLTVSVSPQGSGTVDINPVKDPYTHGDSVTLTPNPAAGYHFLNWSGDVPSGRERENPLVDLVMNQNRDIIAHFNGIPIIVLYGDINGDSLICSYDAALAAHIAVDLEHPDIKNRAAAEVSGDAEVTAYDAALIAQKAVGLIDRFPVEG